MSFVRINGLVLKIIQDNLFKSIFDKEQSDIVTAEVFKTLLESSPPQKQLLLTTKEPAQRLYTLGIYANMFLQSRKVDPSLLSKKFLLNYIYFAIHTVIRSPTVDVNLNVVTKWIAYIPNPSHNPKVAEAEILKDSTSYMATIFRKLSNFYTPAESFTRVRKDFDRAKFVVEASEMMIKGYLSEDIITIFDHFKKWSSKSVLDIFQYKKFRELDIHPYSGNFDLLEIEYNPEKYTSQETDFDWIHLGFYILYKKDSKKIIPSLSAVLESEKETLHEPSNIISAQALFKGNYKNPTPLLDTEIFFTVLESKPYNLENSKKISEELFKKFYMMILMKLEMRKHNIVIYTENLKDWPTDKSRNLQIKSLIRAKDAHRIDLIEREKTVKLVINLNMQDNETIPQKWGITSEIESDQKWRDDHSDTNTTYVEDINLALIKEFPTISELIENTRKYSSIAPTLLQKETILKLVLSYRTLFEKKELEILSTEDQYLVDRQIKSDGNNFAGQILMYIRNELVRKKPLAMELFLKPSEFFAEELFNMQINVERKRPVFIFLPEKSNFYGDELVKGLLEKSRIFLESFSKVVNEKNFSNSENFSKNLKDLYNKELEYDLLIHREKHPYPVWGGDPYLEEIPFEDFGLEDMNLLENPVKIKGEGDDEGDDTRIYKTLSFILWGKEGNFLYIKASLFMYFLKLLYETPEFKGFTKLDFSYLQKFLKKFFENNDAILAFLMPLCFKRTVIIFTSKDINYLENYNKGKERSHINPICMFFNINSRSYIALPSAYTYNNWHYIESQKNRWGISIEKYTPLSEDFMQELSTTIYDIQKVRNWKLGEFTKKDILNSTRYFYDQ